jgi:hypothetical protein
MAVTGMGDDSLKNDIANAIDLHVKNDVEDANRAIGWVVVITDFEIDTVRPYGLFSCPADAMRYANQMEAEHRREEFLSHICVLPLLPPE